jgi:hypothetical protein
VTDTTGCYEVCESHLTRDSTDVCACANPNDEIITVSGSP